MPARSGCSDNARAVELGMMSPMLATSRNRGASNAHRPRSPASSTRRTATPARASTTSAAARIRAGVKRASNRWLSSLAPSIPSAFTANSALKAAGETPYTSW